MELNVVLIFLLAFLTPGIHSVTFTIKNNCPYTIWPATLTNPDKPAISTTGFELGRGAQQNHDAPANWGGRIWARTGRSNNNGRFSCVTADCASGVVACNGAGGVPPASLAEFTLQGDGGKDFYDLSLVDGFNLPVSITSQGCPSTSCGADVNGVCPEAFRLKDSSGATVGCKSACAAFNQPQFCCSGEFATPEKCPPSDYSKATKNVCPQAYSYAYDDRTSTFTCPSGANYLMTFCP